MVQYNIILAVGDSPFSGGWPLWAEVAIIERFKQEQMYGLSAGTKIGDRCNEMAIAERWPLVKV